MIQQVPQVDNAKAGKLYTKQLKLPGGKPNPTWKLVKGPKGSRIGQNGLVQWPPETKDRGETILSVEASNPKGRDSINRQVRINQ